MTEGGGGGGFRAVVSGMYLVPLCFNRHYFIHIYSVFLATSHHFSGACSSPLTFPLLLRKRVMWGIPWGFPLETAFFITGCFDGCSNILLYGGYLYWFVMWRVFRNNGVFCKHKARFWFFFRFLWCLWRFFTFFHIFFTKIPVKTSLHIGNFATMEKRVSFPPRVFLLEKFLVPAKTNSNQWQCKSWV